MLAALRWAMVATRRRGFLELPEALPLKELHPPGPPPVRTPLLVELLPEPGPGPAACPDMPMPPTPPPEGRSPSSRDPNLK